MTFRFWLFLFWTDTHAFTLTIYCINLCNMINYLQTFTFLVIIWNMKWTQSKENARVSSIRRFTGGGTVIVDRSTIFVSFIMNSANVPSQPDPREIIAGTEKIYIPVFSNLFSAELFEVLKLKWSCEINYLLFILWRNLAESAIVPKFSQFSLREHDYVVNDKKLAAMPKR